MKKISPRIANCICFCLILSYIIFLGISWRSIPNTVATHFDASGTPDSFGSKYTLIFEPVLAIFLWGLLSFISHFPQAWNFPVKVTDQNKEKLYQIALFMLNLLKIIVVLLCIYTGIASIISLPIWGLWLLLASVFILIIISIIHMIRLR